MWERLKELRRIEIRNPAELRRYVVLTTLLCIVAAVAIDVVNHMLLFQSWPIAIKSWIVTSLIALVIAAPVSRAIGVAHLNLYRTKQEVEALSRTDPLTGLLNRRALLEIAGKPLTDGMALVIVDIDRFKRVNDIHGHLVGDEVIKSIAHRMVEDLAAVGQVGRIGGEEFALLTAGVPAEVIAESLRTFRDHIAATEIAAGAARVSVTISAGVALKPPARDFTELYSNADRALYVAKKSGRNCVCFLDRSELSYPVRADRDEAAWRDEFADSPAANAVGGNADRRAGSRSLA
jgi:diguanylate cyclase (GGDEF)-like protein